MLRDRVKLMLAACGALALPQPGLAQYSFQGLGVLPGKTGSQAYGVSADGRVVAGMSAAIGGAKAFRWAVEDGMVGLDFDTAVDATADGSTIVGLLDADGCFWTAQDGVVLLTRPLGWVWANARGVADNGAVIAGTANTPNGIEAVRWEQPGDALSLGKLSNAKWAFTNGISADGQTIVGRSGTDTKWTAFRWIQVTGMKSLGTLPGKTTSEAWAASANGSVIVGSSGGRAFKWILSRGMEDIGPGTARGVSADGSVIVGSGGFHGMFYWTQDTGYLDLYDLLASHGVDLKGWDSLGVSGCSADGRTIVGDGDKNGVSQAWIATVAGTCYADCDGQSGLDIDDFICFQVQFAMGDMKADCDFSGELDIDDFICFQTKYAQGCP